MKVSMRKFLFIFLVIVFFLLGSFFLLYSQGYRFDFEEKKLVQTGAIFIKAYPKRAIVKAGKIQKITDPLFGAVLVDNLIPKTYKVVVYKDGYQQWVKNFKIKAGKVTEAKNILLPKKDIRIKELFGFRNIFESPSGEKAIILENTSGGKVSLKLGDFLSQVKSAFLEEEDLRALKPRILKVYWSPKEDAVLITLSDEEKIKYLIANLNSKRTLPINFPEDELVVDIFPLNNKLLYLTLEGGDTLAYIFDYQSQKPEKLKLADSILAYALKNNNFFWLDKNGNLKKVSLENYQNIQNIASIKESEVIKPGDLKRELYPQESFFFIKIESNLYALNFFSKDLFKVDENVGEFAFNKKDEALAYVKNSQELWYFDLKNKTKNKILDAKEKINNLTWINDYHLIYSLPKEVKFLELNLDFSLSQEWTLFTSKEKIQSFNYFAKTREIVVITKDKALVSQKIF